MLFSVAVRQSKQSLQSSDPQSLDPGGNEGNRKGRWGDIFAQSDRLQQGNPSTLADAVFFNIFLLLLSFTCQCYSACMSLSVKHSFSESLLL